MKGLRPSRVRSAGLIRVLSLLRLLLDGREWTLLELAHRFDVTTRTIRRDFETLRAAGFLVEVRRGWDYCDERGRWRLAKGRAA